MGKNIKRLLVSSLYIILLCFITKNNLFTAQNNILKKYIIDLKDFGAIGDGVSDDSKAFINALDYAKKNKFQLINLKGNYVYNLNNSKIQLPNRVVLKFEGPILKNAELIGDNTLIAADPLKIFENIMLSGNYQNTENTFVEWFGTFPNDPSSLDLKKSLEALNRVYFSVSLNEGIYYTNIGNIDLKGIKGISPDQTFVEFRSNSNDKHLFHIGKVGGNVQERTYQNNYLKSLSLVLISHGKKIHNNTLLIIGACHQAKIEDVKFIANSNNTSLNKEELVQISKNSKEKLANMAINFDGASELIYLNNIFTLSDIGLKFAKNTDFVSVNNLSCWNGKNGFASVYFADTTISNVLFSGNQSWSQGLYGLYSENGTGYNNFVNMKVENVRIEQLNTEIKLQEKVVATSFWFGNSTHTPNLILHNIMLAGTANGIRFGSLQDGNITLSNISVFFDRTIRRQFALEANIKKGGNIQISLNQTQLADDLPINIMNSNFNKEVIKNNNFSNELIISSK